MSAATQWESTPAVRDEAPRTGSLAARSRAPFRRGARSCAESTKSGPNQWGPRRSSAEFQHPVQTVASEFFFQLHHHFFQSSPGPLLQTIDLFDRGSHEPRDVARRQGLAGREHDLQAEFGSLNYELQQPIG